MAKVQILFPILAMVILTMVVAGVMLKRRIAAFKEKRIHPQKTALSAQMAALLEDTRASDNFRNLFETPVLFYVAMLTIFSAGLVSATHVWLAWAYVAARYAHSFIQCTSNIVMRRFYAFFASVTLLTAIWLLIGYQLHFGK
jgi:hypothetical protein